MTEFFLRRQALAIAIAACLFGFGVAFVQGGLTSSPGASADPGGLLCVTEQWDAAAHDWTCIRWVHARGTVEFPTRPSGGAACPQIDLDRTRRVWRCSASV